MNISLMTPTTNCCVYEQCQRICPIGGESTPWLYVLVFGGMAICIGVVFLFGRNTGGKDGRENKEDIQ